jgi:transcriptional regulator with XRE-family HTH domain
MEMIDEKQLREAIRVNLPRIRHERKMSQEVLAAAIGVHRVTVARWETGDVAPTSDALINLTEALDVSIDALGKIPENLSAIPCRL